MQFKPGMALENHGKWHVDHRIPRGYAEDGVITMEVMFKRMHYSNTKPEWAPDNRKKNNRTIT